MELLLANEDEDEFWNTHGDYFAEISEDDEFSDNEFGAHSHIHTTRARVAQLKQNAAPTFSARGALAGGGRSASLQDQGVRR